VSKAENAAAPSSMAAQIDAQRVSNRSALRHFDLFAPHREHLTALAKRDVSPDDRKRLCVLGAGNCCDLDLAELGELYHEIHLVDVDEAAVDAARSRQPARARAKIIRHAPVDLSGLVDKLDRWSAMIASAEELMEHPSVTCDRLAARLPGPFDVVLSSCVLTQMQLAALNVLSSSNPLFEAVREILNLTHLRTLATLAAPSGRAILATDLVSSQTFPLEQAAAGRDPGELLEEIVATNEGIHVANPRQLCWTAQIDPMLREAVQIEYPLDVWLWQNGPQHVLLVYAMELRRQRKMKE
jgi:hypothetical protein